MIKQYGAVFVLVLVSFFCGCSQDKVSVESYLSELKTSKATIKLAIAEMQAGIDTLRQKFSLKDFDLLPVKNEMANIGAKVAAEKKRLTEINVPSSASELQTVILKQYDMTIAILEKTPRLIELAKNMSELTKKLGKDIKERSLVINEMRGVQKELTSVQSELEALTKKADELDDKAKEEEAALRQKFGLAVEDKR